MLRSLQREGGERRRIWQAPNQTLGGSQSKNKAYLGGLGILRAFLGLSLIHISSPRDS